MKTPSLKVRNLRKSFGSRTVVDSLSMDLDTGRIVGLLGPNGAGKTTAFYMIAGIIKPDSGLVFMGPTDITPKSLAGRARLGMAYLPQERSIFQGLTVEQNILAVLEFQDISNQERLERKERLLEEFSLQKVSKNTAVSLSGGEARRLEIARALAIEPLFLLMDEPFAGLDPITMTALQKIIVRLKKKGMGILISDHNVRETLKVCDTAFILSNGKILAEGTPEEIAADPRARTVYLGEGFRL